MRRRDLITLIGGAAAGWPVTAHAQQPEQMRRIGVLFAVSESDREGQAWLSAFREGLQQLGWTAGHNIRLDYRWAAPSDAESRQRAAKELVALQPDLILAQNTVSTASILQETHAIPVTFANVVDPIGSGFVASLARPGGNVTGFTLVESSIVGKWLEVLKEIAPRVNRVAFLFNPKAAPYAQYYLTVVNAAAPSLGMEAIEAPINKSSEIEPVIAEQARGQNGGLFLMPDTYADSVGARTEAAALKRGLQELGWIDGRDLELKFGWSSAAPDPIQSTAKELVGSQCDVIVAQSTPGVAALLKETHTVPIVFVVVVDPVGSGFVQSFARPGGNVTGFQNFEFTMVGKWLQLLKEIAPQVQKIGFITMLPRSSLALLHLHANPAPAW